MSEYALDEPIMTSMGFNKKVMNWYRRALKRLLLIRDRGSHALGEQQAVKVYNDLMESFGGYTKVYSGVLDPVCIATMLHKSSVLVSFYPSPKDRLLSHQDFVAELLSMAGEMMSGMSDHHAACVLHYYSMMHPEILRLNLTGISHKDLVQKSVDKVIEKIDEANPRTLSWTLLGMAKMMEDKVETAKTVLRALKGKANESDGDVISAIAYSMAKMNIQDDEGVLSEFLGVIHDQIEKLRPECIGELIWGLAKLEHTDGRAFFSRFLTQYKMNLKMALPQDMARIVDGLAIANYQENGHFLDDLAEVALRHSEYFSREDTELLRNGFENLGIQMKPKFWEEFQYA